VSKRSQEDQQFQAREIRSEERKVHLRLPNCRKRALNTSETVSENREAYGAVVNGRYREAQVGETLKENRWLQLRHISYQQTENEANPSQSHEKQQET